MEVAHGYQRSMALFAALRLGVFSLLGRRPAGAKALAQRIGADPERLAVLLNGLVAMGLLEREEGEYCNGPVARAALAGGPMSKENIILHHLDCWAEWSRLPQKLCPGARGRARGGDYQENFIRGMHENARERAKKAADRFPLRPGERLLDLGGGPGTYAVEWARRFPGARVTLFDTPAALRVTRKILEESGSKGLVRLVAGDFLKDPIGGPYDFVWISQILHAFAKPQCEKILRRAKAALAGGGRVAVQEFLLDEGKVSPPGPALFSVHMVAVTDRGRSYTAGEIARMMRKAGLRGIEACEPDSHGVGVIVGRA